MADKRVAPMIVTSHDIDWNSPYKEHLQMREKELENIWKAKPYRGTIAEPKGSGSEVKCESRN